MEFLAFIIDCNLISTISNKEASVGKGGKTKVKFSTPCPLLYGFFACTLFLLLNKNVSWIYYWRAMTGLHSGTMACSSCGKEIYTGFVTLEMRTKYGDKVNEHKAEGGHVWVDAPDGSNFKGGRYITPLCPACNAKRGQQITILKGSVLCKELGATKDTK